MYEFNINYINVLRLNRIYIIDCNINLLKNVINK
jgi:hypothetical protein